MHNIERQAEVVSRTLLFWFLYFVGEALGDACTYKRGSTTSYVYCEHGCCGSETNRKCCAYEISTSVLVVACVVSGLVVLALIAAVIICCYKNYKDKQQSRVRALRQQQQRNVPVRPAEPPKPPSYIDAPPEYSEEMPDSHYRPRTAMQSNPGNVSYNTRFGGMSRIGPLRPENLHPLGTVPANMTRASGSYDRNNAQLPGAIDDAPPRYSSLDRGQTPITNTSNTANTNHRRFIRTPDANARNNSTIVEEESNSRTETESSITREISTAESREDTQAVRSTSRIPQRVRNLQSRQSSSTSGAPRSRMTTRSSSNVGNHRNTTLSEMGDSDVNSLANI